MQYRAALAMAAVAPLAAANTISITSSCSFPVYLWNVVENYGSGAPTKTLNAGDSWSGQFTARTDQGGGPCLKLKKNDNLFDAGQIAQVEYKMDPNMNTLFYDLSLINGDPFHDNDVTMSVPSRSDCPVINCPAGVYPCPDAYYHPDDPQTKACNNGGGNVQVHLCSGSTGGSSSAPAPAPAKPLPPQPTTLAKQKPSANPAAQGGNFLQEGNDGAVIVTATTVVAVTSTVHVAGPSPDAGKREEHMHLHMRHGHSRVMGRHAH